MKNKFLLLLLPIILFSCSEKEVEFKNLVERNGIMFEVNTNDPFSGKSFEIYENQQTKFKGSYDEGLKDGLWEQFLDNGRITERANYSSGRLDGLFEKFNEKNILIIKSQYKDSILSGDYKEFDDEGKITNEGLYTDALREGAWKFYYKGNLRKESNYKNGKLDGNKKYYLTSKSGNTYRIAESNYKNGKLDGQSTSYIEDGSVTLKTNYLNGEKKGLEEIFTSSGTKISEVVYEKNSIKKRKDWTNEGKLSFEGEYPGTNTWYEGGNKKAEVYFTNLNSIKKETLKIRSGDKLINVFNILKNSFWASNKVNFNMKYINTRKKDYQERLRITENTFDKNQHFINGYGYSRVGWINGGGYEFDIFSLPKLYMNIIPKGRKGKYKTYEVRSISQDEMYLDNVRYRRVQKLMPD